MALIFEYGEVTQSKKVTVPKKKSEELAAYKDMLDARLGDGVDLNMLPGGGVLKRLSDGEYNGEKGDLKNKNGEEGAKAMTATDATTFLSRMNKSMNKYGSDSPKNIVYTSGAGKIMKDIANDTIKAAKVMSMQVQPVKPPKPTDQGDVKVTKAKMTTITKPGGTIRLAASREINADGNKSAINESYDERNVFYDYLEDYDSYYVLSEFFNNPTGKQNWGTLINPEMYVKALRELSRFGKLTNSTFPSKYVYQWMGIIMKNTAILIANTELAGHSINFPGEEVAEYAERIDGIEIGTDYDEGSEWLDEKGLYDWMSMPDGSDAWSDFGIEPLCNIIKEYNDNLPPEKVLVLVNRALDVMHMRGDLSSIFINGGSKVLSKISEEIKRNGKKIYISESQITNIKKSLKK